MCGLVAVLNSSDIHEVKIGELCGTLAHRGPDDHAWMSWSKQGLRFGRDEPVAQGKVVLGHRRLSIIDLSADGRQPMASADGRLHIVYNGEVYNYLELRAELQSLGYKFRTKTDTEVILASISHWGIEVVRRFKGMFALVLLDTQRRKLFAVRDHFGIKPLFYSRFTYGMAFASEIQTLLKLEGVKRELHSQSAYDYLLFGHTGHNQNTMFAGVQQLAPASILEVDVDNLTYSSPRLFWHLGIEGNDCGGYDNAVNRVRDLFMDNVRLHLRSDVPIGAALSGGIDSSAIVCAIREVQPSADIRTFSYIAPDELSEESWVDLVNTHVKAHSIKVRPQAQDMLNDLDDLIRLQGEPFGSTNIYAQYCVFRAASQNGIKVMLDGQGADEMLAGYVGFQGSFFAEQIKRGRLIAALKFLSQSSRWPNRSKALILQMASRQLLPARLQAFGRRVIGKDLTPNWLNIRWFREHGVSFYPQTVKHQGANCLRESLIDSLRSTSLTGLLRYEDRDSMRFSLESRVPFLTYDLAELIIGLPAHYLIADDGRSKRVFRDAMRGIVPSKILERRDKIGFATPESNWSRQMQHLFTPIGNDTRIGQLCNSTELLSHMGHLIKSSNKRDFRIWRIINLWKWMNLYDVSPA